MILYNYSICILMGMEENNEFIIRNYNTNEFINLVEKLIDITKK